MKGPHSQRGMVAVEAALLLAASFVLLPLFLYISGMIYHALVLDNAVYAAARIVAALPDSAYAPGTPSATLPTLGRGYIDEATSEARLWNRPTDGTTILCDGRTCQHGLPGVMTVNTSVYYELAGFSADGFDGVDLSSVEMAPSYKVSYAP